MRFVLVNGRMPFRQSFCALCCEPIGKVGYLRDIRTRLCYCGGECYALKSGDCFSKIKPRFLEQGFLKCRSESSGILKVVGRHEVHPGQS